MLTQSLYHTVVRSAALLCAVVLMFESGIISPLTKQLSDETRFYLANAIGMTAVIEPTELNQQTAILTERMTELDKREQALAAREIAVSLSTNSPASNQTSTYILSLLLFFLLTLIILNYVMDFIRARDNRTFQA